MKNIRDAQAEYFTRGEGENSWGKGKNLWGRAKKK